MNYQPTWIKGKALNTPYERESSDRYELVKAFCAQYRRPFAVLDIGASLCYFGLRLTEDFPDCTVIGIEHTHAGEAFDILRQNAAERIILLSKLIALDDLQQLAECEHFDVVLGLSVIHRFAGTFAERLEVFRSLGDHLIVEVPNEPFTGGNVDPDYVLPDERKLLGYGKSHLVEGGKREIALMSRPKTSISKGYLGSTREDLSLCIYSDFNLKRVVFFNKVESRAWYPGINLNTWIQWGGVWPEKSVIRGQIEAQREAVLKEKHGDIQSWNVVISGDRSTFVDVHGPMEVVYPDAEYFDKLVEALR